jgi:hypothetical protein
MMGVQLLACTQRVGRDLAPFHGGTAPFGPNHVENGLNGTMVRPSSGVRGTAKHRAAGGSVHGNPGGQVPHASMLAPSTPLSALPLSTLQQPQRPQSGSPGHGSAGPSQRPQSNTQAGMGGVAVAMGIPGARTVSSGAGGLGRPGGADQPSSQQLPGPRQQQQQQQPPPIQVVGGASVHDAANSTQSRIMPLGKVPHGPPQRGAPAPAAAQDPEPPPKSADERALKDAVLALLASAPAPEAEY